jgi:hypothetical protein
MLAYLDDLLEPDDAEQIGEKIRDSESAGNLASRICDVTRRLRLGTPKVSGRGGGVNPNTVAEYLDNTLSNERVPEFERACLESDVQLAEVASCHQVLTLVLGEPAEVTPDSRQRMYKLLGSRRVAAAGGHVAAKAPVDAAEKKKKKKRRTRRRTVPDYLREEDAPTSRRWPSVVALVLAAMVVVAALFGLSRLLPDGDNTSGEQLADASVAADGNGAPDTNVKPPAEATDAPGADTPDIGTTPADTASSESVPGDSSSVPPIPATIDDRPPTPPTDEPALAGTDEDGATEAGSDGQSSDAQESDLEDTVVDVGSIAIDPAAPSDDTGAAPTGAKLEQPDSIAGRFRPSTPGVIPDELGDMPLADDEPAPLDDAAAESSLGATAGTDDVAADNSTPKDGVEPDGESLADDPKDGDPLVGPPGSGTAMGVGRFISNDAELLRYDPEEFAWQRLADRRMLQAGDELLSLPVFRPFLTFSDVSVQLVGATHIRILPPDANETIGLQFDYGRIVLMSAGMAGASIRLGLGEDEVLVTFDDADATVAVEVVPRLDPGTDPADAPITRAAHLFVASGKISISGGSGAAQTLEAPVQLALTPAAADEAAAGDETPDWINSDAYVKQLDHSAAEQIHAVLDEDVPLRHSLKELAEHRRVEIRSLAARQLSYLDEFDAVVSALDNEQQRASWPDHFDALRHAVARGQGPAQKVLLALEKRHGNATAADVHRMLWGYTKGQLSEGHAAQLVSFLDNDQLSLRVLAFLNLEEITGKGGGYQPQHNALRRRRAVASWREKYEAGEIVPLEDKETVTTP